MADVGGLTILAVTMACVVRRRAGIILEDAQRIPDVVLETLLVGVPASYRRHRAQLAALIGGPLDAGEGASP